MYRMKIHKVLYHNINAKWQCCITPMQRISVVPQRQCKVSVHYNINAKNQCCYCCITTSMQSAVLQNKLMQRISALFRHQRKSEITRSKCQTTCRKRVLTTDYSRLTNTISSQTQCGVSVNSAGANTGEPNFTYQSDGFKDEPRYALHG